MSDIEDFVESRIADLEEGLHLEMRKVLAEMDSQLSQVLEPLLFVLNQNMTQIALLRKQIAGKADIDVRSEEEGVDRVDPDEEAASTVDQ